MNKMPVLFIGHGNPMNAIEDNEWSRALKALAPTLPRPKSILAISAHWYVPGTYVTVQERPPTIHDFGGFPDELFAVEYPAPGDPDLAKRVIYLTGKDDASLSNEWGIDHGTWSVLVHLFPKADVPVVQLSVDQTLTGEEIIELCDELEPLRKEGVMILASGNITHNLHDAFSRIRSGNLKSPEWAVAFDQEIARAVEERDKAHLWAALTRELGSINHPTPDHFLPLFYAFGLSDDEDKVSYPVTGFDAGSLSMRSIIWS